MLELRNVIKKYKDFTALKGISFDVSCGEVIGLIGANGAGKTTIMRLITRHFSTDKGEVLIGEKNIESIPISECNQIAYIPDEPIYYEFMTVEEHFRFIKAMYPKGEYEVEEIVERFDLTEHLHKFPNTLSKGNLQKMMIGAAILREFDYLIADEPFTGLDPQQIHTFKQILLELKDREKGVLLSTHLLDIVDTFCDKYIILNKGAIVASGTKQNISDVMNVSSDLSMEEVYISLINSTKYGEPMERVS